MHERKSTAKSYALLSDDEHLNERCAKRRSDEAQTPSPHVRAQLFRRRRRRSFRLARLLALSLSLSPLSFSPGVYLGCFYVTLNSRVVVEKSNPRQNIINALWQISRGCRERNETDRDEEQQFCDC